MKWEDPPIGQGTRYDWQAIAEQLRQNPQRWAKIEVKSTTYATLIPRGQVMAFRPAGAYEARTSKGSLFIRYIGEQS
jgi:hypothetical protein